jgi:hypothetical protein
LDIETGGNIQNLYQHNHKIQDGYTITLKIMKQEIIKENIILEDISSDIENELLIEQIVCELESQCTDSSNIPEILKLEKEIQLLDFTKDEFVQFDEDDDYDYFGYKLLTEQIVCELGWNRENPDDNSKNISKK